MPLLRDAFAALWRSTRNRGGLRLEALRGMRLRLGAGPLLQGGEHLLAGRGVVLDIYGTISLGRGVTLSDGCLLRAGPGAHLALGDGVFVGRGTVIAAHGSITVGPRTLIAEHATIRDSDHALGAEERRAQQDTIEPVTLGQDVWIAAGARVLRGSQLGDGVVVAANSVVKGTVGPGLVVAGAPARVVKRVDDGPG